MYIICKILLFIFYKPVIRNFIPSKLYLSLKFYIKMGYFMDFKNPTTFSEKLQYLKLHDRKKQYTDMVDKYAVRNIISESIGEKYLIPLVGGPWNKAEDIDFDSLPNEFVLKCTHDSASVIICKNKNQFDKASAVEKLNKCLKYNHYWLGREWPYKNVHPQIIAEKYMVDESGIELKDYKFFCFNGECRFFKVDFDRTICHHANYYDIDGNLLPFGEVACPPVIDKQIILPSNLNEMIKLAELLSAGYLFIRVDFYNISGQIYFGELTFYPASGLGKIEPIEWDKKIGNWININELQ